MLIARSGGEGLADLNLQRFNAKQLDFAAFEVACQSLPFLSDRRLVILEEAGEALRRLPAERFTQLLECLPPSTALVLIDVYPAESKQKKFPLVEWVQANPQKGYQRQYLIPKGSGFVDWIIERCGALGGKIELPAAQLLAEAVESDPRQADQEIEKLLAYVDYQRPINLVDVEKLTHFESQANIFAMVDAIGNKNGTLAIQHLARLLENEAALYVFTMIVRQFRLLLVAREALDGGLAPALALKPHSPSSFVNDKVISQARNFSLGQLERIYQELHQLDVGSKSGRSDLPTALERLVVERTQRPTI